MTHVIYVIQEVFANIRIAMSGLLLEPHDSAIKGMMGEAYDIEIPHPKEDRKNLKSDGDAVVKDYKKAVDEKKLELHY